MDNELLFQIIQLIILLIVFVFLIRFTWSTFIDKDYQPLAWKKALKDKRIPDALKKAEKRYPDKVRFFNFWFQTERLKREGIPGSFAELGVYKGKTAKIIHLMDPDRTFHLFDTFSGLPSKDLENETGEAATYTTQRFADTKAGKVLNYLGNSDTIHIHPGYFPDTTLGLEEEQYALVSMDCDLYEPTKAGLEYFYPRLSGGGCIIIHDYNHKWEGLQKAVDGFVCNIPESLVPLPDMESTVMIIRNKS